MSLNSGMCSCKRSRGYDELKERYDKLLDIAEDLYKDAFVSIYVSQNDYGDVSDWKQHLEEDYGEPLKELGVIIDE